MWHQHFHKAVFPIYTKTLKTSIVLSSSDWSSCFYAQCFVFLCSFFIILLTLCLVHNIITINWIVIPVLWYISYCQVLTNETDLLFSTTHLCLGFNHLPSLFKLRFIWISLVGWLVGLTDVLKVGFYWAQQQKMTLARSRHNIWALRTQTYNEAWRWKCGLGMGSSPS